MTHQIIDLLVYLVVLGMFLNVLFSNIFLISYWTTLLFINISPDLCADRAPTY